jgi:NADH:ubiquinone oxidoreductase subunit H
MEMGVDLYKYLCQFCYYQFLFLQNILLIYLSSFIITLIKIVLILLTIAYFTLAERKAMASIQRRKGPEIVGI